MVFYVNASNCKEKKIIAIIVNWMNKTTLIKTKRQIMLTLKVNPSQRKKIATCYIGIHERFYKNKHRSQVVSSKQPKLGLTQELSSRISESTKGYIFTHCVGYFTSLGIYTR